MKPGVFIVKAFVRYVIPVPMGNKVRSNDILKETKHIHQMEFQLLCHLGNAQD